MKGIAAILCICALFVGTAFSRFLQQDQGVLVKRMHQYENNILNTYLEYQKLYYEDKSSVNELEAFEELLTVYINQVMEIYETLTLAERKTQTPRNIAARTLIFKALMFLEKAPLNIEYYEKACYEYYEALRLYQNTDEPPVIYRDLPQVIQAGDKTYYRLIDLLQDKGQGLLSFGKVNISFKNFMVTANFDPQMIELIKVPDPNHLDSEYTFELAESRIKKAFAEVFRSSGEVETYVALPYGTYILRLNSGNLNDYTPLTIFYVRANQEHYQIMEPLADWIILYQNPTSKRPDFYKFRRNNQNLGTGAFSTTDDFQKSSNGRTVKRKGSKNISQEISTSHEKLVAEIVAQFLTQFEIKLMFDLSDPEIRDNAIQIISHSIVNYVESREFYNEWNLWTASWNISKHVREIISPGSQIPVELIELIYHTLKEL
ncbi:MAG: hypothetical protein ACE5JB_06750 [bacterium]